MQIQNIINITDPTILTALAGIAIAIISGIVRGITSAKDSDALTVASVILAIIGRTVFLAGFIAFTFTAIGNSDSGEIIQLATKTAVCGFALAIFAGNFGAIASLLEEERKESLKQIAKITGTVGKVAMIVGIFGCLAKMIIK